jgi:hypothetical protein
MSAKRRLQKLKRKTRVARQAPKQQAAVTEEFDDDMVFPHGPAMAELMREDPECREMMLLLNGVGFKFFEQRVWVTAPRKMEDNSCFEKLLAEAIIGHYCGFEKYQAVHRSEGYQAATKLFDGIDLDIVYYDQGPSFAFDDDLFEDPE